MKYLFRITYDLDSEYLLQIQQAYYSRLLNNKKAWIGSVKRLLT